MRRFVFFFLEFSLFSAGFYYWEKMRSCSLMKFVGMTLQFCAHNANELCA